MSAFEILPGDPRSTVVLHVPHSSRLVPTDVREGIVLDDAALERELDAMTDAFTDVVAQRAADASGARPWVFVNRLSRLVVDPERFPDDREEMNAVGMGAVYTRTSDGHVLREEAAAGASGLVDRFFAPYAEALAALVAERLDAVGSVTIIDVHSFPREALPYELHGDGPRPEICLGTDAFHTSPALVAAARQSLWPAGVDGHVDVDTPFAGCYVPMDRYRTDSMVQALMVEIRRDLITHDPRTPDDRGIDRLARGLAALVDRAETLAPTYEHPDGPSLARALGVDDVRLLADSMRVRCGGDLSDELVLEDLGAHLRIAFGDSETRRPFPISVHEVEVVLELLGDPPADVREVSQAQPLGVTLPFAKVALEYHDTSGVEAEVSEREASGLLNHLSRVLGDRLVDLPWDNSNDDPTECRSEGRHGIAMEPDGTCTYCGTV